VREGDAARVAASPRHGLVDQDSEHPRLQRRAAFEAAETLDDPDPGVLDHVLGRLLGRHIDAGEPNHRGVIPVDQARERLLVPGAEGSDETSLVVMPHAGSQEPTPPLSIYPRRVETDRWTVADFGSSRAEFRQ
jgi:hypothetical protein